MGERDRAAEKGKGDMCLDARGRTRIQRMRSIYYIGCREAYRIACTLEGREEKRRGSARASLYRDSRTYEQLRVRTQETRFECK